MQYPEHGEDVDQDRAKYWRNDTNDNDDDVLKGNKKKELQQQKPTESIKRSRFAKNPSARCLQHATHLATQLVLSAVQK